jgi:4a-hydroxytetrahydrobiopterin dehydratase
MSPILESDAVDVALKTLPCWSRSGSAIEKWFEFAEFSAAANFVQVVASLAEEMNHHPDIDVRYRRVRIFLTTHSVGGITCLDVDLARRIDAARVS